MNSKHTFILVLMLIILILAVLFAILLMGNITSSEPTKQFIQHLGTQNGYNPQINPTDFTTEINNKYLTFTPGTKFIYEGETEEGTERIEVYVTNEKKKVMGVNTLVVWDRVWLNDELIEDTNDWFAQDKYGNVWYFGEDSKELIDWKVISTDGSWEAGIDGAKPGIIMRSNPIVGESYRQEYYQGEAEDMAEVISLGVKVKVKYSSFSNCLQTKEWNPLEPGDDEYKYYCPEVRGLVYEVGIEDGKGYQLIDIQKDSDSKQLSKMEERAEELKKDITEKQAIAIALQKLDGEVTDVEIEKKYGKVAYVVEIDDGRGETDVIIDIETGEVLGIEK